MNKIGTYQPIEKYKNYSLSTTKPDSSHSFYQEKVWNLQDHIYKKLKKVAEFLESLYPKLTEDFRGNIKHVIEKNLETLKHDLNLMQSNLLKNPYSFNTKKLKINQHCINEMKNVCNTLQTVRSYEHEFKKLSQIKHVLHELEHLIQPTSFERSLEMGGGVKSSLKTVPAKKTGILVGDKKKINEKAIIIPKKQKAVSKKAKPTTKLLKPKKVESKKLPKSKAPLHKLKQAGKKITKPKAKLSVKPKKVFTAKPKAKIKSPAARKSKLLATNKKA